MNADRERLFYYIGTGLFILGILEVTLLPYVLYTFFPSFPYILPVKHRVMVLLLFLSGFTAYIFSPKYYRLQLAAIFLLYFAFCVFQMVYRFLLTAS